MFSGSTKISCFYCSIIGKYIRLDIEDSNYLEVYDGEEYYSVYPGFIRKSTEGKNRLVFKWRDYNRWIQKTFNVFAFIDHNISVELAE